MGLKVSAAQAATLVDRNERRVREWLRTGKIAAEKSGNTWLIDTDDLARMPGVTIDRDRLAVIEAEHARTPGGLLARLEALEREVQTLRRRVLSLETGSSGASGGSHSAESVLALPRWQPTSPEPFAGVKPPAPPDLPLSAPQRHSAQDELLTLLASRHGVSRGTARGHADHAWIPVYRGTMPNRPNEHPYYVRREDYPTIIAYWRDVNSNGLRTCVDDAACPCHTLLAD